MTMVPVMVLSVLNMLSPSTEMRTFVAPFSASGTTDGEIATTLTEIVTGVFSEDLRRHVLSPRDMAEVMKWKANEQALGCDEQCTREVADALDVQRLVTGSVNGTRGQFHITLKEIDVEESRVVGSVEELIASTDLRALVLKVRMLATRLRDVTSSRELHAEGGTLVIYAPAVEASVIVDGIPVGQTPVTLSEIRSGTHVVSVEGGRARIDVPVAVIANEETRVDVIFLEPRRNVDIEAIYDTESQMQIATGVGKLFCAGLYSACAIAGVGVTAAWLVPGEGDADYIGAVSTAIVTGALVVPAAALVLWGGIDLANPPEAPVPVVPVHEVTVTTTERGAAPRRIQVRDTSTTQKY